MKRCRKCQIEKAASEFFNDPRNSDGMQAYCKPCKNEMSRISANRRSLAKKPICKREGCENKVGLRKRFYCSSYCNTKDHNDALWERQKVDPNYKAYHRGIAREWARRNRVSKTN